MLRSPHPLPGRFNRPVTRETRRLVKHSLKRPHASLQRRWQRSLQRLQRRGEALKHIAGRAVLVLVPLALVFCLCVLLFSPLLHLQQMSITRSDPRIDVEHIQRSLAPLFGRHLFFLPPSEVHDLVVDAVPDLASVEVVKQYPSSLALRLTLHPIIAKLTIDDPDLPKQTGSGAVEPSQAGKEFLTAKGMYVVYSDAQVQPGIAYSATGGALPVLRIVDWGVRPVPWQPLLEPTLLHSLFEAERELAGQFNQKTTGRTVYLRAREYHLHIGNISLWFDLRSPLSEQLRRYSLFLRSADKDTVKEYVDLRLADRIIYR